MSTQIIHQEIDIIFKLLIILLNDGIKHFETHPLQIVDYDHSEIEKQFLWDSEGSQL